MNSHRFLGWLCSSILVLTALTGQPALAAQPAPAYTAPFHIEKIDYPADTYTGTHISVAYNSTVNHSYITYYDVTLHDLKLAFNPWPQPTGNCNGIQGHWTCLTLDGDGQNGHTADDVGKYTTLDVSTVAFLNIGISYYDATLQAVKYILYSCAFSCIETIETVDDPGNGLNAGSYGTAIKFTQTGTPYIAYSFTNLSDHSQDGLRLAYRIGSGGNCGDGAAYQKWECVTVDRGVSVGQYPSMALHEDSGLILQIAYLAGGHTLQYAINNGEECYPGGPAHWNCSIIDSQAGGDISIFSTLEAAGIAYYAPASGQLRYATFVGSVPTANCGPNTWRCDDIEAIGAGQAHADLSLTFGPSAYPAIAYRQVPKVGPTSLRIARPIGVYNVDPGNCGPTPSGGGFEPTWLCRTVDSGNSNADEADFVGIGILPGGLAVIAFTEDDSYNGTSRLMVAMQQVYTYLPGVRK